MSFSFPKLTGTPGLTTLFSLVLFIGAVAGGCSSKSKRISAENDTLRASILDLESQVARLSAENTQLTQQLKLAAGPAPLAQQTAQAAPRVASISIDNLSHAIDSDSDALPDALLIYITSTDGLQRTIQLVGELSLHAAILPPSADALTIGRISLNPLELRDAYRSSFMGTHYTITLPISIPPEVRRSLTDDALRQCLVQASFIDTLTDSTFKAEKSVSLRIAPKPQAGSP